jgi:hypothetical protein
LAERFHTVKNLVWGAVVGLITVIIQVIAGVERPLRLLIPALVVFVIVAVFLEWGPRLRIGSRLREAWGRAAAHLPYTVTIRRRHPVMVPEGEPGLWDFRRDAERAMIAMTATSQEMGQSIERAGKRVGVHTRRMVKAAQRRIGVEGVYKLAEASAKDINDHAVKMEELEGRFREQEASMAKNFTDWLRGNPDPEQVTATVAELQGLADVVAEARDATAAYRTSVQENRKQNTARPLNQATDRLSAVLTRVIEDYSLTEQFLRNPLGRTSRSQDRRNRRGQET